MLEKRIILVVLLVFAISFSSAFSFPEFLSKITGNTISESCPKGLVAYYPFNGSANDVSGNGYNGVPTNVVQTSGILGQAYRFDGSSYITLPGAINASGIFSVSLWVRTDNQGSKNLFREMISKIGGGETGEFEINIHDMPEPAGAGNGIGFMGWISGRGIMDINSNAVNIRDSNWHNIIISYKSGSQTAYIDGNLVGSNTYSGGIPPTSNQIQIGGTNWHYYHPRWIGDIDEVSIWDKFLTQSDVSDLYNSGFGKEVCSLTPPAPKAQNVETCFDSDGINENITGNLNVSICQILSGQLISCNTSVSFDTDICLSQNIVKEFYCSGNNKTSTNIACPNNCSDGRCIRSTQNSSCSDICSLNVCSGNGFLSCSDINNDGCNELDSTITPCQTGTVCHNGNCIALAVSVCGNGIIEQGEECDFSSNNGGCPNLCSSSCTINAGCSTEQSLLDSAVQQTSASCSGCLFEGDCLPIGYRILKEETPSYCDISGIKPQKVNTKSSVQSCQNNFECSTNLCSSGECVEFSGTTASFVTLVCKLSNLINKEEYNACLDKFIYGIDNPVEMCNSDWRCGEWSICDGSQRTRICSDWNNCGIEQNKPTIVEQCISTETAPEQITEVVSTEKSFSWWKPSTWSDVSN